MSSMQLRIVTDNETASEISTDLRGDDSVERSSDPREVSDPGSLGFDLGQAMEIISFVQAVFFTAPIVPTALNFLRGKRKQRLVMETPLGRVTVEPDQQLGDDEIRALLRKLSGAL